jgi:hypothetical protein
VVTVAGAPEPPRRRFGRAKPRLADPAAESTVPLTTLTVIKPQRLGSDEEAEGWLERLRDDDDEMRGELAGALGLVNRAVHAHRTAVLDPHLPDVAGDHALAVRIGYGSGEDLADGAYTAAIEIPRSARRRRGDALQPQERVAAAMGGGERIPACELLVLRARADLDAGRHREAALQLQAAVESLLAERGAFGAEGQEADLVALEARDESVRGAASGALEGGLPDEAVADVAGALALAERILRRQRALAAPRG